MLPGYSEGDWQTVSIPEAVGGNLTWTDVPSAELVFYFEGSAIEILYSRGPEGGDFHISLDDITWPQFNGYAEQYLYGTSIQQFNIAPGIHQLVITNDDGALWLEAIRVQEGELLPATQWTAYASDDPEVLYTGMWASMPSVNPTIGSVTYSFTGERSISVRFQGTGIRVIYSREYQSGLNLQAELDNTAIQSVSNPAPSENTQHEIVFDALPYGEHTLYITIAAGTLWVERIDIQGILLPSEAPLESSAPTSAPLALELTLPLVFTEVSTVEELISAVEAANTANNEHHVILLAPGTYTFDSSHRMWNEAGLIVTAYKTVTFIGMGGVDPETGDSLLPADNPASQSWPWATLEMNPADSMNLLDTQGGSTVRLYNIRLSGGGGNPSTRYAGAGIRNGGNLFLYNSRLEDNNANVKAGAILNFAKLTTINTALSDNHAVYGSAVYKVQTTSIFSYCSTYEGNIAYLGALYLETGDSVDIRHSNFIGNETFDENFDTFADVDSLSAVTLPNNYWSGSVGESVSENVNRSPQSPTRILYGSFSNEGEPCYVPPPPTLCPTSPFQAQAFGTSGNESFLSPVCQPTNFCIIKVNENINAYTTPVVALTEKIQYPGEIAPSVPYEPSTRVFAPGTQLVITNFYGYVHDQGTAEEFSFNEEDVVLVTFYNLSPNDPDVYDADDPDWTWLAPGFLWINYDDGDGVNRATQVINGIGHGCDVLEPEADLSENARYAAIEELREYGVEIIENAQPWSETDLNEVLEGVRQTARAFFEINASTGVRTLFKNVMIDEENDYMVLLRLASQQPEPGNPEYDPDLDVYYNNLSNGVCASFQGTPGEVPRTIACRGVVNVTEFTVVHEFGHIFDNRSDRALYSAVTNSNTTCIQDPSTVAPNEPCITDDDRQVVMGAIDRGDGTTMWNRGNRGWGSGPGFSDFQQHPPGYIVGEDVYDETAADLFLNWVYRIVTNNPITYEIAPGNWSGFLNMSWLNPDRGGQNCTSGCDDDRYPGDARHNWTNYRVEILLPR